MPEILSSPNMYYFLESQMFYSIFLLNSLILSSLLKSCVPLLNFPIHQTFSSNYSDVFGFPSTCNFILSNSSKSLNLFYSRSRTRNVWSEFKTPYMLSLQLLFRQSLYICIKYINKLYSLWLFTSIQ